MKNSVIKRTVKMASYALAITLVLGGVALARDDDDYYRQGNSAQARQYGYQNGYNEGARYGREGRRHDPDDYRTHDWRQATRGYKNWMGPISCYQRGYQEGYSNGFRSGYRNNGGWRDGDGDRDDRRSNDGWRGGYGPTGAATSSTKPTATATTMGRLRPAAISKKESRTTQNHGAATKTATTAIGANMATRTSTRPNTPTVIAQDTTRAFAIGTKRQ